MDSNNTSAMTELNFACNRHRILCQQLYVPSLQVSAMVHIVLNALLAVTAVLGNGLIFAAYYQNQTLRKPANTILLSLAATDFLTGAISQPLFIYEKIVMLGSCAETICVIIKISRFFILLLIGATLFNLSVTTLDRYIAICHSFRYPELVTNSRVRKLSSILWFVAVCASLLAFFISRVNRVGVVILCTNMIFIGVLYFKIYRAIRRIETNAVAAVNEPEEARKARERKSAKAVAIIIGLLILCYVPMVLTGIVSILNGGKIFVVKEHMLLFGSTAAFSNSTLNVLVYYWRNEEMRVAMLKVIKKITRRFNNEV